MTQRFLSYLHRVDPSSGTCCPRTGRLFVLIALLSVGTLLGACAPGQTQFVETQQQDQGVTKAAQPDARPDQAEGVQDPEVDTQGAARAPADAAGPSIRKELWRVDRQGAVEVAVQPVEVTDEQGGMILFEVAMNTHSVDLSMDLSRLSTLSSDLGETLSALSWTGGSGHHVGGYLSFPLFTPEGTSLLEGSQTVTLTIESVDAQERVFEWDLAEMLQ